MKKLIILFAVLFSAASFCMADDNKPRPIPLGPKGNSTQGPVISDSQFSPSAYYTSDTLTVEFASYAGIAVISIIDEVTGTAVSQEIGHITATANTVQTDISNLPDGSYTLSIVPQTGDEYEGEFTIQRE